MAYQVAEIWHELDFKKYIKNICPFFFKSAVMFIVMYVFNYIDMSSAVRLLLQIMAGGLVYLILNFRYMMMLLRNRK